MSKSNKIIHNGGINVSNVIRFNLYNRGKKDMSIEKIVSSLKKKNKDGYVYSIEDIKKIATDILDNIGYYSSRGATPIVKIASEFEFKTYKETLKDGRSGDIHINGDTKEKYNHDKIILVNKNDEYFHQRFVVAHELAHYLFEFLGNPEYQNVNKAFTDTYCKDHHEKEEEKRANIFAAEIMMPEKLFVQQYNIASKENNNRMFIVMYLSRFFETSIESIEKRLTEVSNK